MFSFIRKMMRSKSGCWCACNWCMRGMHCNNPPCYGG